MATKKTSIGGQALMEGIMMRGPRKTAMAVRNPKGEIVLEQWENGKMKSKQSEQTSGDASFCKEGSDKPYEVPKIFKLPIIRGIYGMITSFTVGYKCLMRSAEIALDELDEDQVKSDEKPSEVSEKAETIADQPISDSAVASSENNDEEIKSEEAPEKKKTDALMSVVMTIGTLLGVLLAVVLFIYLPTLLYDLTLQKVLHLEGYVANIVRSLFEGILKIAIMVAYMSLVSLMKDIRRTFMYHGAEHKTIFCYEQGLPLTVENIRKMRRFHPRCGTSFLILMLLVSIIIGAFVPFTGILRAVCKLILLPLTIGIGYELIKLAGRHDNLFTRIISAPGVWLQHITTQEPTDDMIECAIAAMNEVIPENSTDDNW